MGKYLKKFENYASYEEARQNLILPNVSFCVQENEVYYNPWTPPNDVITYNASEKLDETPGGWTSGLHTDAFNATIKFHTFENGVGTIEFNDDVTSIGYQAFYGCTGMTSIELPNSVTSIGNMAFYNCSSLTSIDIPSGVTSISDEAFQGCTSLTSITIPEGVTSIGHIAFFQCPSLTSIVVDSANTVYDSRDNCNAIVNTSTNELIAGCKNTVIPNTVTSIGERTFTWCSGLTSIDIPDSVTSIGTMAFGECSGITSCTIGNGVTRIGGEVFYNCSSLTSITSNRTTAPSIQNSTFANIKTGGTLTVPSGSSGYNVWMRTGNYYLGKYNWTKVEQ